MLLPTMLPMAISALAWMAANILTTSYGVDVPKATMVRPTTRSLTLRIRAMEDDPSTRKSAPLISSAKPTISNPYVSIRTISICESPADSMQNGAAARMQNYENQR